MDKVANDNWSDLKDILCPAIKLWFYRLRHLPSLQLSQRRAESAVRYIVQHGIAPDRLVAKGYGEEIPIARNTNPDGTDNPVGRQKNRRTEFKILEINAVPKTLETDDAFDEDKYFKDGNN